VRDRLIDHAMGAVLVLWAGILVALALGGCATRLHTTKKETTQKTWTAATTAEATSTATSATVAASRTVRVQRRTEKRPDGTVVDSTTTTTTEAGATTSVTAVAVSSSTSAAQGAAASRSEETQDRSSKPSAGWLPWWGWVVLAALVAGGTGWVIHRWVPGLWMRLVTRVRG
jgi:cobalamin biosynthesis Mg chelatase CobN